MDLIERVGSYVGLAAFLGLAILALLYFSQARDVRRLRDWAGRAPERAVEGAGRTTETTPAAETAQLPAAQHHLPATPFSATAARKRKPLRERLRNVHVPEARYFALVAAGLVVLGGAAYGAVQLVGGDDNTTKATQAGKQAGDHANRGKREDGNRAANVDPSQVTVAVLNGTTVPGLAAKVGEEVIANGFQRGVVGNAAKIDQSRSEVLYQKGQAQAARAVANRLGIQATGPVDSVNAEIAGSFDAVVLVGADRGG